MVTSCTHPKKDFLTLLATLTSKNNTRRKCFLRDCLYTNSMYMHSTFIFRCAHIHTNIE